MPTPAPHLPFVEYKHLSVTQTGDALRVELPRLQTREHYYAVVRELGELLKMIDQSDQWTVDVSHLRYVPHLIADILIEFARRRRETRHGFHIVGLQSDRLSTNYLNQLLPHILDSEETVSASV